VFEFVLDYGDLRRPERVRTAHILPSVLVEARGAWLIETSPRKVWRSGRSRLDGTLRIRALHERKAIMMRSRQQQGAFALVALGTLVWWTVAAIAQPEKPDEPAKQIKWERRHGQLKGHTGDHWMLALSPDGQTLAVASWTSFADSAPELKLWDVSGTEPRQRHTLVGHKAVPVLISFAPDGKTLLSVGADGAAKVWDVERGKAGAAFAVGEKGDHNNVEGAWVSGSGNSLVVFPPPRTAGGFGDARPVPPRVQLWDLRTGKLRGVVPVPPGQHGLAVSPDGTTLVCGTGPTDDALVISESPLRFWNLSTGRLAGSVNLQGVTKAMFSPTGKSVLFQRINPANEQPSLAIWDVTARKGIIPAAPALKNSYAHGFSGDGKYLVTAAADQRTVNVWELSTEKPVGSLQPLEAPVAAGALSGDGRALAVVTNLDNTLHLWTCKRP
jgi:WD40 repeat protein